MYTEKIAVYSEFPTKYIYSLCGQNAEFQYVKPGGICSNNWSLIRTQQDKSRVHKSQGTTLCTVKPDIFSRHTGVFTLTYKNVSQYTWTGQKDRYQWGSPVATELWLLNVEIASFHPSGA